MARLAGGARFPDIRLQGLDGRARGVSEAWARGPVLVALGHSECETTRLALRYVDRIHRRAAGGAALAVLQDEATAAERLREELELTLPILLEGDPYPLASVLDLETVPALAVVGPDGRVETAWEAFRRGELEGAAARLGVATPLFEPGDDAPAFRPG